MKLNIRLFLLCLLMGVLLLPLANMCLHFYLSEPLRGDVHPATDTPPDHYEWQDGSLQHQKELFLNDNIGFRPDLVRINNELDMLLYGKMHANGVVLGKEGCLYESGYIDARRGLDFMGYDAAHEIVRKLRYVQDTLARAGKAMMFVFTPSKGRYFPEFFPNSQPLEGRPPTNYEVLQHLCDSMGVNNMDINGWFLSQKAKTRQPHFYRQGIHWARWAAVQAADSFNRNLEKRLGIDIPDIVSGEATAAATPLKGEDDISQGLNLLWPVAKETWWRRKHHFIEDSDTKQKPAVIFISDSFFWTWCDEDIPQHCYRNWEFWYYFNEMWSQDVLAGKKPMEHITDNTWLPHIATCDAFVIFLTEPNLGGIDARFVNELYRRLGGK